MKVLKSGKRWSKKCKCTGHGNGDGGCEAELEVEAGDLYTTSRHCYGDDYPTTYFTFTCPECGIETDITGITYSVEKNLVSKKQYFNKLANNGD
jgi:hypothetical protein